MLPPSGVKTADDDDLKKIMFALHKNALNLQMFLPTTSLQSTETLLLKELDVK